ncbi:MAG: SiaC family regulatory phosphoprotein [Bacteroidales bacterium]|nr:SiaC family regulatory phosphoprotein [Bacteroidales bacterium]
MNQFQSLVIEQTSRSPQIVLNHLSGELLLYGKSIPENASKVYEPVFNWVKEYILRARPVTNLRINLEYFNTSTSIWITKIIRALNCIYNPEYLLMVHLYIPLEEYYNLKEFDDLNDLFNPITDVFNNTSACVGLKLHAVNSKSEIVRDALILFQADTQMG